MEKCVWHNHTEVSRDTPHFRHWRTWHWWRDQGNQSYWWHCLLHKLTHHTECVQTGARLEASVLTHCWRGSASFLTPLPNKLHGSIGRKHHFERSPRGIGYWHGSERAKRLGNSIKGIHSHSPWLWVWALPTHLRLSGAALWPFNRFWSESCQGRELPCTWNWDCLWSLQCG